MITAKIDGRTVKIPTQWSEVTYRDFIELSVLKNDLVAQLAYLMGMTKDEFSNGTFSESLDSIFVTTKFLTKCPIRQYPETLGVYTPGRDIRTMAQLNAISEECEVNVKTEDTRGKMQGLARIAAIQCQGLDEPFDAEKARYLGETFMSLPCLEVYETGFYFFAKAMSLVYRKDVEFFRPGFKFDNRKPSFFSRLWQSR